MTKEPELPLTPQEKLANLHSSLADDVSAGYVEVDDRTKRRAATVLGEAIDKAVKSRDGLNSADETWTKRTDDSEPPVNERTK